MDFQQTVYPITIDRNLAATFGRTKAAVLTWLWNWSRSDKRLLPGGWVFGSCRHIAEQLAYCRNTIARVLRDLLDRGLIERSRAFPGTTNRTWKYRLNIDKLQALVSIGREKISKSSEIPREAIAETPSAPATSESKLDPEVERLSAIAPAVAPQLIERAIAKYDIATVERTLEAVAGAGDRLDNPSGAFKYKLANGDWNMERLNTNLEYLNAVGNRQQWRQETKSNLRRLSDRENRPTDDREETAYTDAKGKQGVAKLWDFEVCPGTIYPAYVSFLSEKRWGIDEPMRRSNAIAEIYNNPERAENTTWKDFLAFADRAAETVATLRANGLGDRATLPHHFAPQEPPTKEEVARKLANLGEVNALTPSPVPASARSTVALPAPSPEKALPEEVETLEPVADADADEGDPSALESLLIESGVAIEERTLEAIANYPEEAIVKAAAFAKTKRFEPTEAFLSRLYTYASKSALEGAQLLAKALRAGTQKKEPPKAEIEALEWLNEPRPEEPSEAFVEILSRNPGNKAQLIEKIEAHPHWTWIVQGDRVERF
jgi:hypothetical protein